MVRRLLVLLLALVLMPVTLPSAARGAATARRHGSLAERTPGFIQIASLTEPRALHAPLARTRGRGPGGAVLDGAAYPLHRRGCASPARAHRSDVLGAACTLVPLRM